MTTRDEYLYKLRREIPQVEPAEARLLREQGTLLVDVREPEETAAGLPENARAISRGYLELRIEEIAPDRDQPILLMCGSGTRSLFAAEGLGRLGYSDVRSVTGGFNRWKDEGLPWRIPQSGQRERYLRQLNLPEVGEAGQRELGRARVLLIGAGGLGAPAGLYLAAAGVGTIGIVDHDTVDRSNLHRQVIHSEARVGRPKVESARETLLGLNPTVDVVGHPVRLSSDNVETVLGDYDLVVDGSDNFPTRYLVNDACVRLGLPNVHGSVSRFEGQVSVFWPGRPANPGPCYRCLYPEPPPPELAPSCNEAGVLGVVPGTIGMLQATETLKLILDVGEPLVGRLLCYNALRGEFRNLRLHPDPGCPYCSPGTPFPGYIDYEHFCNAAGG